MMTVIFKKAGKEYCGTVVASGQFVVDGTECYEIDVAALPHICFIVPVAECRVI